MVSRSDATTPAQSSVVRISTFGLRLKFSNMRRAMIHAKTMNPTTKNVMTFCFMLPKKVFIARLIVGFNEVLSSAT